MKRRNPMRNNQGKVICGATTRQGTPCQRPPLAGRTRCRLHGGATPVGVASPHYKGGTYSTHIPRRMGEVYDQRRADPDILARTEEIALLQTRLLDVLCRSDTGEAGAVWTQMKGAWREFQAARGRGDTVGMNAQLELIGQAINRGAAEAAAWEEIGTLIERMRRLTETEQKRRVAMQQMVTVEKLDLLLGYIVAAVEKHVTDDRMLKAVSAELAKVIG